MKFRRPDFVIALLFLFFASPLLAAPQSLHHDLKVRLDPDRQRLEGTDRIVVKKDGATRLDFDLAPGAEIVSVTVSGKNASHSFRRGRLSVKLPKGAPEEVPVEIRYRARFADAAPVDPVMTEDPSYGVAGTIGPQGAFLGSGARWYPELRGSVGTFRLEVETPEGMSAVSDGRLVLHDPGRTIWESDRPMRGLALAAGPFEKLEGRAGDTPVYTFFYPRSRDLAETYLKASIGYITLYQDLFGPYPFEKFAVVENFFPTGYGFPSWTLLGSTIVRLPFIVDTSLGHEVAHCWWGNGVRVDYRGGNWSEGLTTYVADYLYKERESRQEGRAYRLQILRDYATLVPPKREMALEDFTHRSTAAERAVGYGKAAMVFHMARRAVGEEAFWGGLRRMAQERMFESASWGDFARYLGAQGESDLSDFFSQWVERPGAPVLSLEEVRSERSGAQWRVSGVVRQDSPPYALRIPVRLETEGGAQQIVVDSAAPSTPFEMTSDTPPLRLVVDPEADLFRRLDASEIPAMVNGIKGSTSLRVIAAEGLPEETREASRILLAAFGTPGAEIRPEAKVSLDDLRGHDVLYLGLPSRGDLLPRAPKGLELAPAGAVLNGRAYHDPQDALFIALPHPAEPGRTAALFLPGSAGAAADAARRIPHYGKYSYLAFVQGKNVDKGVWSVETSPLIHLFVNR